MSTNLTKTTAEAMRGAAAVRLPNATNAELRAVMEQAAVRLFPRIADYIEQGAEEDPLKAAATILQLAEFHMPKLARTDHSLDETTVAALTAAQRRDTIRDLLKELHSAPEGAAPDTGHASKIKKD